MDEPLTRKDIEKMIQDGINSFVNQKQFSLSKIQSHRHDGADSPLIAAVTLPAETPIRLGLGGVVSAGINLGTAAEQTATSIVTGKEQEGQAIGTTTINAQMNLLFADNTASPTTNLAFFNAYRPPLYQNTTGTTTTTTIGGSTITIPGYNFETNYLAGSLIVIINSAGATVETQTIASNTATVVTITGTWLATTTNGTFLIMNPVYLGSADAPWQRVYTCEGTGGGVRFGVGATAGGQNGMLYMDATGDLYWRDKAGTSTKLN